MYLLFLDTLFPQHCRGCNKPQPLLCISCTNMITFLPFQICPYCKKQKTSFGQSCITCARKFPLDGIFVMAAYSNRLLSHCIHGLKYECIREFAPLLGVLLSTALKTSHIPLPHALIPIPLHPRRLRWRGFNQSLEIAKSLQNSSLSLKNIPIIEPLIRHRFSIPQMKISDRKQRKKNIEDAFIWNPAQPPLSTPQASQQGTQHSSYIAWLIDDVTTTTATLSACAALLKKHGATNVYGIVLAR